MSVEVLELPNSKDAPRPFLSHLDELRRRIMVSVSILAAGVVIGFYFSGNVLSFLARPVGSLVFMNPTEAFFTRLEVSTCVGLIATLPLILYQAYLFVAPALTPQWKNRVFAFIPISYALFLIGAALSFFVAVPAAMKFLLSYGSPQIKPLIGLEHYLRFVINLMLGCGVLFQFPLILYALNHAGLLKKSALRSYWRQIYLLCFIAPVLITPDPVSQIALAAFSILLFEASLLLMRG
jgi:sec-independent protein translocase protein TatC